MKVITTLLPLTTEKGPMKCGGGGERDVSEARYEGSDVVDPLRVAEPVTYVVPAAGRSINSSTSTADVDVVLKVTVYLIRALLLVEETTDEDAVTTTENELLATPERFIAEPKERLVISECLY
jgi:hypothetical protein